MQNANCLHEGRRSAPSSPVCCRRRSGQRATRHDFVPVCALRRPAPCPGGYGERFAHTRRQHRAHGAVYGRQGPVLSAMRPRAAAHAAFQTDPPMAACSRGVPCSQARISTAKSFQTQHTPHHPYIAHENLQIRLTPAKKEIQKKIPRSIANATARVPHVRTPTVRLSNALDLFYRTG